MSDDDDDIDIGDILAEMKAEGYELQDQEKDHKKALEAEATKKAEAERAAAAANPKHKKKDKEKDKTPETPVKKDKAEDKGSAKEGKDKAKAKAEPKDHKDHKEHKEHKDKATDRKSLRGEPETPKKSKDSAAQPAKPNGDAPAPEKKERKKKHTKQRKRPERAPKSEGAIAVRWEDVEKDEEEFREVDSEPFIGDPQRDPFLDGEEHEYDYSQYLEDIEDPLGTRGTVERKPDEVLGSVRRHKTKGLDLTQDNFNPKLYLAERHKDTPLDELIAGKERLQNKVRSRQRQLEDLVRENFPRFVMCKDAVDTICGNIDLQKSKTGNPPGFLVETSEQSFQQLIKKSHSLFDTLLDRQREIDKIRNVLSILKRSQFIFNLPQRMRENIAKNEYSKVVLNYKKVRSLISTTGNSSIRNIVRQVESIVKDLQGQLFQSLDRPGQTLASQEETIRLLVDLGSTTDPAWHCISKRYDSIKTLLSQTKGKFTPSLPNKSPSSRGLTLNLNGVDSSSSQAVNVRTYSNVLKENIPELWTLARNFFSGEYHKSLSEKRRKELSDPHSEEEFASKIKEIMRLYAEVVRKNFSVDFSAFTKKLRTKKTKHGSKRRGDSSKEREKDKDSVKEKLGLKLKKDKPSIPLLALPALAMPNPAFQFEDDEDHDKEKVSSVLECWKAIEKLNLTKKELGYFQALTDLLEFITRRFTTETFTVTVHELKQLYASEEWDVVDQQFMITSLPYAFDNVLKSILAELEGLISSNDLLVVYIQKQMWECISIFADNLHHLAFNIIPNASSNSTLPSADLHSDYDSPLDSVPHAAKLLLALNNCRYTRGVVVPNIANHFEAIFGRKLFTNAQAILFPFERLEDMIIRKYSCYKTLVFNSLIRNDLLFSGFDWMTQTPALGIRDYVMTLLLQLVFCHDELFKYSRSLLEPLLASLLENIYQAYTECLDFVQKFSQQGAIQVGMELEFISTVTAKFKSDPASALYKDLDTYLGYTSIVTSPEWSAKEKKSIKTIIKSKQTQTSLLFECFLSGAQ